ncbi:YTH domain-containing protein 1-like isoform X2 [Liolophura sinensis]|uniref:YTH domain-containing protein 1-like isoform X2 n=1 Tax=Liolophura sinensis TaxID=3198878 RepID=UPI003158CD32
MSEEAPDSKGVEDNVLDFILDAHTGDDYLTLTGEIDESTKKEKEKGSAQKSFKKEVVKKAKPGVRVKSAKSKTAQNSGSVPVKKKSSSANSVKAKNSTSSNSTKTVTKSESESTKAVVTGEDIPVKKEVKKVRKVTSSKSEGVKKTVTKSSGDKKVVRKVSSKGSSKIAPKKAVSKTQKVVVKIDPEAEFEAEPEPEPEPERESVEDFQGDNSGEEESHLDESDDKLNLSLTAEEPEDIKPAPEPMETQAYDTRSEAGSSEGESTHSDTETSISDSGEDEERVQRSRSPIDRERGERGISPIEWDQRSEQEHQEREARRYSSRMKYIFRDARYFLIKSNNHENVALAKAKGVWSTPPQNEAKLNTAFRDCSNVILVFSVKESGKFQGFARLAQESTKDHPQIRWVLPVGLSVKALSGVFKLDWINRKELPFTRATHLHNPWNDNKPVKIGRDGQEVAPSVGETLCKLFPPDDNVELSPIVRKARRASHRSSHTRDRRMERPWGPSRHGDFPRRRRHHDDVFEPPRRKRSRHDYDHRDGFYRDRRDGRGSQRYSGVRRETFINGSYSDYMREFHHTRPPPPPGVPPYCPPPPGYGHMEAMAPYPGHQYNRPPRDYGPPPDYHHGGPPPNARSSRPEHKRSRNSRSYERDVDDFLRRTTHGTSRDRHRHRDRR